MCSGRFVKLFLQPHNPERIQLKPRFSRARPQLADQLRFLIGRADGERQRQRRPRVIARQIRRRLAADPGDAQRGAFVLPKGERLDAAR